MDAQDVTSLCTCQATSGKAVLTSKRTERSVARHVLAQMDNRKRSEIVCLLYIKFTYLYVVHTESFLFSVKAKIECTFANQEVLQHVSA